MALGMLGMPQITSFDDTNNSAKLCKTFFSVLRDRCLRDHKWSFATAFLPLQILDETSPDPVYPFVAPLPGDCIRVLRLQSRTQYRKTGNKILLKTHPDTLEYIRRIYDSEMFDATFTEALQYLIASEIGMAATRDAQLISMYRKEYENRLAIARSIDSAENAACHQTGSPASAFLAARRAGTAMPTHGKITWTTGNAGIQE